MRKSHLSDPCQKPTPFVNNSNDRLIPQPQETHGREQDTQSSNKGWAHLRISNLLGIATPTRFSVKACTIPPTFTKATGRTCSADKPRIFFGAEQGPSKSIGGTHQPLSSAIAIFHKNLRQSNEPDLTKISGRSQSPNLNVRKSFPPQGHHSRHCQTQVHHKATPIRKKAIAYRSQVAKHNHTTRHFSTNAVFKCGDLAEPSVRKSSCANASESHWHGIITTRRVCIYHAEASPSRRSFLQLS